MAGRADNDAERVRFLDMLTRDVDRLERLVSGVRELARIDTELEQEPLGRVDVGRLLQDVVDGLRLAEPDGPAVILTVGRSSSGPRPIDWRRSSRTYSPTRAASRPAAPTSRFQWAPTRRATAAS